MLFLGKIGMRSVVLPAAAGLAITMIAGIFLSGKVKKLLTDLLLLLFSSTVFLLIGEVVLRNALADSFYYRPVERFLAPNVLMPERLTHYMKNTTYEGETYGDMIAMSGLFEYQEKRSVRHETDELGFRNKAGKPKIRSKYLILGDSFGSGVGSHQDSTISSFLEKETDAPVYNLSFPGYPYQGLLNLAIYYDKISLEENPTVIWFLFTGNDLPFPDRDPAREKLVNSINARQLDQYLEKSFFTKAKVKIESFFARSAYRKLRAQFRWHKQLDIEGNPDIKVSFLPSGKAFLMHQTYIESAVKSAEEVKSLGDFEAFERVIETAASFCRSKGANLKIVVLPTKYEIYQWIYNGMPEPACPYVPSGFSEVVAEICNMADIDCYDAGPFFYKYSSALFKNKDQFTWWRDDTHFNANGYRALTEFVIDTVLSAKE